MLNRWVEKVGRNDEGGRYHEWLLVADINNRVIATIEAKSNDETWEVEFPGYATCYACLPEFLTLEDAQAFTETVIERLGRCRTRWGRRRAFRKLVLL